MHAQPQKNTSQTLCVHMNVDIKYIYSVHIAAFLGYSMNVSSSLEQ
jgi:hypothetical protein